MSLRMHRLTSLVTPFIVLTMSLAFAPPARSELPPMREFLPHAGATAGPTPDTPVISATSGDVIWVNAHTSGTACPGGFGHGGEASGGHGAHEVWCFEGGPGDSTSVVGSRTYTFRSYDRRPLRNDLDSLYWHADTFQAVSGTHSMWCGGNNDRCGSWIVTTGGYGNYWQQCMQLDLAGPFNLTNGCSLQFKQRYTVECNYDYGFLEVWSFRTNRWNIVDQFNGKSGCTVISPTKVCQGDWNNYDGTGLCPGSTYGSVVTYPQNFRGTPPRDYPNFPYVGAGNAYVLIRGDSVATTPSSTPIRLRWRFMSDTGLSAADGNTQVKGWWVDDVTLRAAGSTIHSQNFDAVPVGGLPGAPYSFPRIDPVYDGWAIRYDLDPPLEGYFLPSPGDSGLPSACQVNASWQWSITANGIIIPAPPSPPLPLPGFEIVLESPAIPVNYTDSDPGQGPPPFSKPKVSVQYDAFQNTDPTTCDYTDTWVRVHRTTGIGPWTATGAWCEWVNIDGFILYGGGDFWNFDLGEDLGQYTSLTGVDSVQFAWVALDVGRPGDACWDPSLPPHTGTQFVIDNVSFKIEDGAATTFAAGTRQGRFQDTFNVHSCMHTENVANNDLGSGRYLLHAASESLQYTILDPDGLASGNVTLWYSTNGGAFVPKLMNLSEPSTVDPASGGTWRTTICDTPWAPGTQIRYYIQATDGLGNSGYEPSTASPTASPRTFANVDVLPTPGVRILFVDDEGGSAPDFTPCRQETVSRAEEDYYTQVLSALGFGYRVPGGFDKYDVNSASSNQRINEPWGFWSASPATPDSGFRQYDVIIWTTGAGINVNTVQDTTQTFLKQFVFHGGKLLMSGDRIGENLDAPTVPSDPDFYGNLLGADYVGYHSNGLNCPDRFPRVPSSGPVFSAGDTMHIYLGCNALRADMDKIRLKTSGVPAWSHPSGYLLYQDTSAPFDSVAGIYNFVTFSSDTGKVVYLPWSLSALVDDYTVTGDPPPSSPTQDVGLGRFQGRGPLVQDILRIFGLATRTDIASSAGAGFVNALSPAHPNPFNPRTELNFSLAADGRVTIAIFDVSGRRVRTLVDEVRSAGPHREIWDGHNDGGHNVASGLYFARMQTRGFAATEKLTLLK